MPIYYLLVSAWMLLAQAGSSDLASGDILSAAERAQFEKADIEHRIKVYKAASDRIQNELESAILKEDFQSAPDIIQRWNSLLTKSLEDIEASLKSKKKSRALINFEIQLRKSIARMDSLKIRASVDLQDSFDSSMEHAEKVRKRFVEIFFRP